MAIKRIQIKWTKTKNCEMRTFGQIKATLIVLYAYLMWAADSTLFSALSIYFVNSFPTYDKIAILKMTSS